MSVCDVGQKLCLLSLVNPSRPDTKTIGFNCKRTAGSLTFIKFITFHNLLMAFVSSFILCRHSKHQQFGIIALPQDTVPLVLNVVFGHGTSYLKSYV